MLSVLGRDRVQWLTVAALIATCNALAASMFASVKTFGLFGAVLSTFGINPIFWIAAFAAVAIAFEDGATAPMRRGDGLVAGAVLLLVLSPFYSAATVGVVLAAVWLFLTSRRGSRGRRAAAVLLALTTSLIWGPLVLMLLGEWLLSLDGQFVAWMAGTQAQGNLVDFTTPGKPLMIAYGCSSMHNLTMAIQLTVAMTQQLRLPFSPQVLLIGLAAIVANVLVNGARIATIAHHREAFDYWHVGAGATLYAWLAVLVVSVIVVIGCHALAPRRI